jgi:hypothetical protein
LGKKAAAEAIATALSVLVVVVFDIVIANPLDVAGAPRDGILIAVIAGTGRATEQTSESLYP